MKLKTRLLMPLFAILMLGMATSAFADLKCDVTATVGAAPGAMPKAIVNGHMEQPADITFTCAPVAGAFPAAQPTTDTSITVYYAGLPITNTTAIQAGQHIISVQNTAGALAAALDTTRADTGTAAVSNGGSLVAINLPGSAGAAPAGGTFVLQNVLLSLSGGTTVGGSVTANINAVSQTGVTVLAGAPLLVISSVQQMLNNTTTPPALVANPAFPLEPVGPAQFTSTGGIPPANVSCNTANCRNNKATFSITVTEDHSDSWRSAATYYANGSAIPGSGGVALNSTAILYTFSGMLPGAQISNCVTTPSNAGQTWTLTGSGIAGTNGQTTIVAEASTTEANPHNTLDSLTVACGTGIGTPAYLPGTSVGAATTAITVDVRPFPNGTALPGMGGAAATTGGIPRYNATGGVAGPVTVVQFGASAVGQTTLLIPYALANVGNFDTGFAIANTTKDPVFGTDAQGFAAPDTAGAITFNFFPGDGSANFAITPTTGFNLVSGQVPAGNSFIGTLSQLLKSANNTAPFQGYVIAVANFTHAHGSAYVYGGGASDRLTSATDVLVISNPLGVSRGAFGTTVTIPTVPPVTFTTNPVVGVEPTSK